MRVLLTGHTGYLGSRVAASLNRIGVDWYPLAGRLEQLTPASLDFNSVIHCAGALRNRPSEFACANTLGTQRLVDALSNPARIVFVSTRSIYPLNGHRLINEDEEVAPFDGYGASKLAAEDILRHSVHRFAILRSSGIFGHPVRSGIFLDKVVDLALANQPVTLAVPDREEDYVPVDWIADAIAQAALTGNADGEILNLGGLPRSLKGILHSLDQVLRQAGCPPLAIQNRELPMPGYPLLDSRKAIHTLGLPDSPADVDVYAQMIAGRLATMPRQIAE